MREDILRRPEIDTLIRDSQGVIEHTRVPIVRREHENLVTIVALLWLFGKRISEILRLKREDVWVDGKYLYVRFIVLKKPGVWEPAVRKRYLKRINTSHPYVKLVQDYVEPLVDPDVLLFSLGRSKVWRMLKALNPNVYPHFSGRVLQLAWQSRGPTHLS